MRSSGWLKLLLLLPLTGAVSTQEKMKKIMEIRCRADMFTTARNGDLYLVEGDVLTRYDDKGQPRATFSRKVWGDIAAVDAGTSLKHLVFYSSPARISFLDNNLALLNEESFDLTELGYENVRLACFSEEAGFWIYDASKDVLFRLDQEAKSVLSESGILSQVTAGRSEPVFLQESGGKLYVLMKTGTIHAFDHFGAYSGKLPVSGVRFMQAWGKNLMYLDSASVKLKWWNPFTFHSGETDLPEDSIAGFRIGNEKLYLLLPGRLSVYGFEGG